MRPKKSIILFDEDQQSGSELTFILNTAIHAKVHRVDSPESYSAALETETYNHTIKGVRGVYNRAEYADQRREMLQAWADMVDEWRKA